MPDINLLPEEFREKEKKEVAAASKKAGGSGIKMSKPEEEPVAKKPKAKMKFWPGLFGNKKSLAPTSIIQSDQSEEEIDLESDLESVRFSQKTPTLADKDKVSMPKTKPTPLPPPPSDSGLMAKKEAPDLDQHLAEVKDEIKPAKTKTRLGLFGRSRSRLKRSSQVIASHLPSEEAPKSRSKRKRRAKSENAELDVNLIPEELVDEEEKNLSQRFTGSGLIILLAVAVVGLAYLGLIWYRFTVNLKINDLDLEIQQLENQITSRQATKSAAVSLQERLQVIKDLLDNHIYWTQFFSLLEKHTIDDVYYTNFSMVGTKELVLSAIGRDYESAARQLVAFQQAADFISQAEVNAVLSQLDDDANIAHVAFSINLKFKPDIFLKPIK